MHDAHRLVSNILSVINKSFKTCSYVYMQDCQREQDTTYITENVLIGFVHIFVAWIPKPVLYGFLLYISLMSIDGNHSNVS